MFEQGFGYVFFQKKEKNEVVYVSLLKEFRMMYRFVFRFSLA